MSAEKSKTVAAAGGGVGACRQMEYVNRMDRFKWITSAGEGAAMNGQVSQGIKHDAAAVAPSD